MQDFDPILALLQELPSEGPDSGYFRERVKKRMDQLDVVNEHLSKQVSARSFCPIRCIFRMQIIDRNVHFV